MTDLPTGAVTFLFTDIEGSTRLVKRLREAYAGVLAEHQRLLREAFAAHRGVEVDTQGDSFFVAFASARDAVLAAVGAQQALLSHEWPDGVRVKVRMGLHTGQAVVSDGRYTGLAVHRAARIGAAAHGAQVLLSQATQTLLEDEEEELHLTLRDLGEQQLKDLDRPVRLFQAEAKGLPSTFPALRGSADLAAAASAALSRPFWRHRAVLAGLAIGLAAASVGLFLGLRGGRAGLHAVAPNHVAEVDPKTNRILAQIPTGIRPGPIAAGQGVVWAANLDDKSVTRIDAENHAATATVAFASQTPSGIAVGGGAVWVVHGLSGQLSRIDTEFNRVSRTTDVTPSGSPPGRAAVAVGAGFVWAAYADSSLTRVDPATGRAVSARVAGANPAAMVVADGEVWVVNSGDATVTRFNPRTFREGPIKTTSVGSRPLGIAAGGGYLWIADAGDDAVTRLDPSTDSTLSIPVGDNPVAITFGAGAVWVANAGARTVSRIDVGKTAVSATTRIGSVPAGLVFAGGRLWISAQAP